MSATPMIAVMSEDVRMMPPARTRVNRDFPDDRGLSYTIC
jgi:hypothetical protein